MRRRRRGPAQAVLLSVLVAGCAESSAVAPGPQLTTPPPEQEDDAWALVPAEADLLLFADLAKLRGSPWTSASFAKVTSQDNRDGVDIIRGMDRVLFAKLPALRDGASLLVAQGNVDRAAIRKGFERDRPAQLSTYRGAELLSRDDEAVAFLGPRTVLSGYALGVRAALDCNTGVAPAAESESWLKSLRTGLDRDHTSAPVAALYVHLQPATREALMREMGEGDTLEAVGMRVDLGADLDANAIGVVRTQAQARDLAGRLGERLREAQTRPIVAAFGLGHVIESIRLTPDDTRVHASLRISQAERSEIAERMSAVADTIAKMRGERSDDRTKDAGTSRNKP